MDINDAERDAAALPVQGLRAFRRETRFARMLTLVAGYAEPVLYNRFLTPLGILSRVTHAFAHAAFQHYAFEPCVAARSRQHAVAFASVLRPCTRRFRLC